MAGVRVAVSASSGPRARRGLRGRAGAAPSLSVWIGTRARPSGASSIRALAVDLVKDAGSLGVLASLFGLWVVLAYGIQRNAMPRFDGDEWLPHLVGAGISSGLMAALMMCLPVLDVYVHRSMGRRSGAGMGWFMAHRLLAQCFSGLLLLLVVLNGTFSPAWSPEVLSAVIIVLGALADLSLTQARTVTGPSRRGWPELGEAVVQRLGLHAMQIFVLLWLWLIVMQRFDLDGEAGVRIACALVVVCLALYRAFFVWIFLTDGTARGRLLCLLALVAGISAFFAPEILRVAGLANLPKARLQLELATARTVVGHLEGVDAAGALQCDASGKGSGDGCTVRLTVDVVSGVGSSYLLAAKGTLVDRKAATCNTVHEQRTAFRRDSFACIQIPRDAVKAVLR